MNYAEMLIKHQKEYDDFAKDKVFFIFAINEKDFDNKLKKHKVTKEEISHICGGGYIKKIYKQDLIDMFYRQKEEKQNAINADKDGTGFIKSMFIYELVNHEFLYTLDTEDTLNSLHLTTDDINNNPALRNGLDLAIKELTGEDD